MSHQLFYIFLVCPRVSISIIVSLSLVLHLLLPHLMLTGNLFQQTVILQSAGLCYFKSPPQLTPDGI